MKSQLISAAALLLASACSAPAATTSDAGPAHATDASVGSACSLDTDCSQGTEPTCLTADAGFATGYCASTCSPDGGGCAGSDPCVSDVFVNNAGKPISVCLETCKANSDCRADYNCLHEGGQSFCWPFCHTSSDCLDANETCDATTGLCSAPAGGTDAGGPPPSGLGGSVVTVPLSGCAVVGYNAQVTVGGTQTFAMSIDTGSTTTGVASSTCTNCGVNPTYTPGTTGANTGQLTSSQYGSGSWQAEVYQDTVQVGPEMPPVTMYFAAITSQRAFFLNSNCQGGTGELSQGILGMGPLDLDTIGMLPSDAYFTDLVAAASIPDLFAVQLCSMGGGKMWMGGFDASIMTEAPQYTPIAPLSSTAQPFWAVNLLDVGLGGTSLGATDFGASVVDTGTYGFLMPTDAYNALITALSANAAVTQAFGANMVNAMFVTGGMCLSPTNTTTTPAELDAALPPLTMTFPTAAGGSFTLSMPATESYLIPITQTPTCYVAGVGDSGMIGETIIGASTQSSHVTIFDPANNRIGFAPATGCP